MPDNKLEQLLELHLGLLKKNALKRINADNFTSVKSELGKSWEKIEKIGIKLPVAHKREVDNQLKKAFEDAVRAQAVREEQSRIKERIRQEERVAIEARKAAEQAERESRKIQEALDEALKNSSDQHSVEIEALRQQLADAEARGQRAKSMAQQTKRGFVYIISNIGSFGEGVYKIGMTRRLEPQDRVDELGDASVPFPFDVHALVECEDAPTLEHKLHLAFNHQRINKINLRKEFFRVSLPEVISAAEKHVGATITYKLEPEAAEYLSGRDVKDEDLDIAATVIEEPLDD